MSQAVIKALGLGKFSIKGLLNFSTVPALRYQGIEQFAAHNQLTIDLAGVNYSDSSGLALLVEWLRYAQEKQKSIVFEGMPQQMQAIAKVTGLASILR